MQVFKNNVEVLYTMSRVEANILLDWVKTGQEAVSYTHLTLPTIYSV